jgi:uncharacterized protein YraI
MNPWKCSMLSASMLALSTGWAAAAPAVVLDYLNLRFGPGYDYYIITVIPAGWTVNAGVCADGWCQVNVNGIIGFVDANYLGVPTPTYWTTATYPNYASYYGYSGYGYSGYGYSRAGYAGYYGRPYVYDDYYAKGKDADLKAARRLTERPNDVAGTPRGGPAPLHAAKPPTIGGTAALHPVKPPSIGGTAALHPVKPATGPTTTGAGTPLLRPNRADQYSQR